MVAQKHRAKIAKKATVELFVSSIALREPPVSLKASKPHFLLLKCVGTYFTSSLCIYMYMYMATHAAN